MRKLIGENPASLFLLVLCVLGFPQTVFSQSHEPEAPLAHPAATDTNPTREIWRKLLGLPKQSIPPVLVRVLLADGLPDEHKRDLISELERSLVTLNDVERVAVFSGHTDNEDPLSFPL